MECGDLKASVGVTLPLADTVMQLPLKDNCYCSAIEIEIFLPLLRK
jgi:hypothetical protein